MTSLVVARIRDMIVTDALHLGEQLSENTLAARLGCSRMPVREAFLRLEAERLVVVRPQRGTFVFDYDATQLREICELRAVLETGALGIALGRNRVGLLRVLRKHLEEAEPVVPLGPAAYQPMDTAFHEALVAAAQNGELAEAYARVSGRIRAIRYRVTRSAAQTASSQRTHRRILDLLERGRDAEAETQLGSHVYNSYRFFMEMKCHDGSADASGAIRDGEEERA